MKILLRISESARSAIEGWLSRRNQNGFAMIYGYRDFRLIGQILCICSEIPVPFLIYPPEPEPTKSIPAFREMVRIVVSQAPQEA